MRYTITFLVFLMLGIQVKMYPVPDASMQFNELFTAIRDGKITKTQALKELKELLPQIKKEYYAKGGKDFPKTFRVFPVQGYTSAAIGGKNGSGYIASRYDFFDGNKHTGHPAHDIFIHDADQDGMDDRTKKPVNILSISGGIVVALENEWPETSNLRGGKYICIYEPSSDCFFYYAHNSHVIAKLGDVLQPGDLIAEMGRTGMNAFKKRSPTHLHVMKLVLDNNSYPHADNLYSELLHMQLKK